MQNVTMQILFPKIISQSAADTLYPPQDDNTHYVIGYLNDRDPPVNAKNPGPPGVPANAYASTALKLEVLTGFVNKRLQGFSKILAITVSPDEENESAGGRMIAGNVFPPTFPDNLRWVRTYVPNKTDRGNLHYGLTTASLAKTSLTASIKVYTSDLEPRPHPTTGQEWQVEIRFPLMQWRMKNPPNTEQYGRGGGHSGGEGRGGGGGHGTPSGQGVQGGFQP